MLAISLLSLSEQRAGMWATMKWLTFISPGLLREGHRGRVSLCYNDCNKEVSDKASCIVSINKIDTDNKSSKADKDADVGAVTMFYKSVYSHSYDDTCHYSYRYEQFFHSRYSAINWWRYCRELVR